MSVTWQGPLKKVTALQCAVEIANMELNWTLKVGQNIPTPQPKV